ncbi:hypothetical protein GCM10009087_33850 [Sphingomonas oligophenolica]|uniref:TonB-dependent receptor n=1 Tax=Sphingomonas oligophenolica TaxID=301154 RepID=A0ABU9XYR1_9SPHN
MRRIGIFVFLLASSAPVVAQDKPVPAPKPQPAPADQGNSDEPDVIVTGSRNLPGSVVGDIPPEQQLGPADIRSYGVSSVSDLLNELAPQTTSGRGSGGAPVVLLNGKRISGFAEIRDIPTEAIARVEILPEEVALKYGYRADQKVVNIVLRRRFRATTVELADKAATAGGRNNPDAELDLLKIRGDGRFNLHTSYQSNTALTEDERDIAPQANATPGSVDQRPYRTLLPSSRDFSANLVYARPIGKASATVNARVEATDSIGLNGLPGISLTVPAGNPFSTSATDAVVDRTPDGYLPLHQRNSALTYHLGSTLNGNMGKWRWSVTGNYDRVDSETFTDTGLDFSTFQQRIKAGDPTANPFGPLTNAGITTLPGYRAFSTSNNAGADALVNGPVLELPAGPLFASVRVGGEISDLSSRSYRDVFTPADIKRNTVNGQINVDVPITSRTKHFLSAIGSLSLNFNLAEDHLSDFGTMETIGYGANWSPIEAIRIIASATNQDVAPTAVQLGNPIITTPNVRVFDYVRGETATVTTESGGNPDLIAEKTHVRKIGLTVKPWAAKDINFTANYVSNRTDNPIAAFPTPTAAIEAAFPGRFARDSDHRLIGLDTRPINFAGSESSQLRWGINFSVPLKSKIQKEFEAFRAGKGPNPLAGIPLPRGFRRPDGGQPGGNNGAPPPDGGVPGGGGDRDGGGGQGRGGFGGGGFGGGGRGGFGGRGGGGGRLQFAVYHTWYFTDTVLVQNGGPRLDLLNGDAIGGSGGQSRHQVEVQAGYSNNGLGFRLSGNYRSGTRVNGGTPGNPEPLDFSGLGTADIRLFADLTQKLDLLRKHPWVRGMRITLAVTNILDSKQRVTDSNGGTPISYQPDYLDPMGRAVRLSIRKLFF